MPEIAMSHYKVTLALILALTFTLCENVSLAQTADETARVASRELATRLLSAKTESEQTALLEAQPQLITVDLVQELRKQAEGFLQRRELPQALSALRLTRSIAERVGDEQNAAFAVF